MKKDSNLFNFAFVTINALLLGLGSLCLGLRSIFSAGVLAGWDKGQLLIFSSYTFGLFTLIALVLGSIFLAYPLLRKNKKLLFGITIFLDWIFLIYLAADAFIYPLYRTHLNFAMIQMTFLGGGRIVSFSLPMIFEIAAWILGLGLLSWIFTFISFKLATFKKLSLTALVLVLAGFCCSNLCYSWGFANFNTRLVSVFDKIPLARPLRMAFEAACSS